MAEEFELKIGQAVGVMRSGCETPSTAIVHSRLGGDIFYDFGAYATNLPNCVLQIPLPGEEFQQILIGKVEYERERQDRIRQENQRRWDATSDGRESRGNLGKRIMRLIRTLS